MKVRRKRLTMSLAGATAFASAAVYWTMASPFSQALGRYPYRGDTSEKVVALTFDDGPNEPYTSQIADVLASAGVRATFFQVGACIIRHPEVTARLAADGHVVANHSYSHRFTRCFRANVVQEEIRRTQNLIVEHTGRTSALYRPPWLLRIPDLHSILSDHSMQPVLGEFGHPFEVFQPSPSRIAGRAVRKVRPGSILIFHDGFDGRGGNRANTAAAIPEIIARLRRRGFRFVTVDELLGIPAYR